MNDEQADEPKKTTPARDWTTRRPRQDSLGARYLAGSGLNNLVKQLNLVTRSPVLDMVAEVQRSIVPLVQFPEPRIYEGLAKIVVPKMDLPALVPATTKVLEAWQPHMNVVAALAENSMAKQVANTGLARSLQAVQPLFDQYQHLSVWPTISFVQNINETLLPLQRMVQPVFNDLVRQWTEVAHFGTGLARSLARAALFAAMRARRAVLHGELTDVDAFITDWLDQTPTPWRREAVAAVLLEDHWIPAEPEAAGLEVIDNIKTRAEAEARNHKWIADTQLRGHQVVMLDRPLPHPDGSGLLTLADVLPDPKSKDGLPLDLGFSDERLNALLRRLDPDEQAVVIAYGEGRSETWESAAIAAGLSPDYGERVRRKCKRERDVIARRAAAAASRATQPGLINFERR